MKLLITFCFCLLVLVLTTSCGPDAKKLEEQKKQAIADSLQREKDINRIKEIKAKYEYPDFYYDDYEKAQLFEINTRFNLNNPPAARFWFRILESGELKFASVYFAR